MKKGRKRRVKKRVKKTRNYDDWICVQCVQCVQCEVQKKYIKAQNYDELEGPKCELQKSARLRWLTKKLERAIRKSEKNPAFFRGKGGKRRKPLPRGNRWSPVPLPWTFHSFEIGRAAAPKGEMSCKTQGKSMHMSVYWSVQSPTVAVWLGADKLINRQKYAHISPVFCCPETNTDLQRNKFGHAKRQMRTVTSSSPSPPPPCIWKRKTRYGRMDQWTDGQTLI